MDNSRYSLPGFRHPGPPEDPLRTHLRPGCSLEVDLGPAFEGHSTPAFQVRIFRRHGTWQECVFSSSTGQLIFHRTLEKGKRLQLVLYHSDLADTLPAGDYTLQVEPETHTLDGPYGQYPYEALRHLQFHTV